jgi:hypothetical protein
MRTRGTKEKDNAENRYAAQRDENTPRARRLFHIPMRVTHMIFYDSAPRNQTGALYQTDGIRNAYYWQRCWRAATRRTRARAYYAPV